MPQAVGVWRATVIDNVDFYYPLEVKADGKLDRLEALRARASFSSALDTLRRRLD